MRAQNLVGGGGEEGKQDSERKKQEEAEQAKRELEVEITSDEYKSFDESYTEILKIQSIGSDTPDHILEQDDFKAVMFVRNQLLHGEIEVPSIEEQPNVTLCFVIGRCVPLPRSEVTTFAIVTVY